MSEHPYNLDAELVIIRMGTRVEVITGPDRGLIGTVIEIDQDSDLITIRDMTDGIATDTEYIADELRVIPEDTELI